MAAPAIDEGTAIEAVLGAEQCQQVLVVPLLDRTLDDDVEGIRRLVLLDNCFVRTEVGDIERRTQRLDLCWRQTIKRRICSVESLGHCTLKSRGLGIALTASSGPNLNAPWRLPHRCRFGCAQTARRSRAGRSWPVCCGPGWKTAICRRRQAPSRISLGCPA